MAAAVADNDHPVEQGFIQVFSVFIDTIIISTLTGFVVCMAALWADPSVDWATLSNVKIDIFLQSIEKLMPGKHLPGQHRRSLCLAGLWPVRLYHPAGRHRILRDLRHQDYG